VSRRTAGIVAWTLVVFSAVVGFTGVGLTLWAEGDALGYFAADGLAITIFLVSGVVGALIASHLPSNPIGWIFLVLVVSLGLSGGADGYVALSLERGHTGALVPWAAWYTSKVFIVLFATVFFSLLLFPDGRLPTRRWRAVLWTGTTGLLVSAVAVAFSPGPLDEYPEFENPIGIESGVVDWLALPGFVLFSAGLVGAAISVVVRFRRARGVERQQLTVLVAAGVAGAAAFIGGVFVTTLTGSEELGIATTMLGMLAIPVGIGVAMLRYRLYEVDRVISRTLVYAVLTVILGAAYAGLVLAGQALFSSFAGGGNLAIAGSTLVVAALFLPLRSRVQRVVDRRFNRRRYDAQRTLEAFGARLREQVELEALQSDLRAVVDETMQPAHASVWLRDGGRA
jgi:hypothetical protein